MSDEEKPEKRRGSRRSGNVVEFSGACNKLIAA